MIKQKLKICKTCQDPSYIFSHGNCKRCAGLKKLSEKPKFKPLTQTESGQTAKVFKYIPKFNKKNAANLAKYRRLRDKYFIEHPTCEFPGCGSRKITLHHKRGRIGAFLTDKRYFCSLCHEHHVFVETHPVEAKKMGLSDSRLENGILLSTAI